MISFLRHVPVLCFFLFFCLPGYAQEIGSEQALKLVNKNSAQIGLNDVDIENMRVTNAYTDKLSGMKLIYLQQSYQGVPVYNSIQVVVLKKKPFSL